MLRAVRCIRAIAAPIAFGLVVILHTACSSGGSVPDTEGSPTQFSGASVSYTALVLEPEVGFQVEDLDAALNGAVRVIERRVNEFGLVQSPVYRLGDDRISVQLPGFNPEEAVRLIGRTGLLQFCEPLVDSAGSVATLEAGAIRYAPQTCEPALDQEGNIIIDPGEDREGNVIPPGEITFQAWTRGGANNPRDEVIVWVPATGVVDGVELRLDGHFLRPNTSFVTIQGQVLEAPTLFFEFRGDGEDLLEQITERLATRSYPFAPFLDGEPIRDSDNLMIAPQVQQALAGGQGTITGLNLETAEELSTLLNTGAFPILLRIIEQTEVIESNASALCFTRRILARLRR